MDDTAPENPNVADLPATDGHEADQVSQDQDETTALHPSEPDMQPSQAFDGHGDLRQGGGNKPEVQVGIDLPRPTPPSVSADHQTVIDYLHAVVNHLRAELRALGVGLEL